MSARIQPFIAHIKNRIIEDPVLAQTFNKQNVHRRQLSQVRGPQYPCITMFYDFDPRRTFAEIDKLQVYIEVHTDQFFDAEEVTNKLVDLFHLYKTSTADFTLYRMDSMGGLASPVHDSKLNKWSSTLQFEVQLG